MEKDYSYLKQLDAEGWYAELTRLYKLSVDHDLGLHEADPNIHVTTDAGVTNIVQVGTPTLLFIGPRSEGFTLTREWLPALIVNVNAPDKVILKELERTLKEIRKHLKPPRANPGRYALNSYFDKETFKKWRNDKIVHLAELLAWRATPDAPERSSYPDHIPDHVLGGWLFKDPEPKDTSEAKATLKKALASLPALAAQIVHDMVPAQIAQELIAARIAKDMKQRG